MAVLVVEAAAVGVVEKVSVVLGSHTELDCGEGAGILWTRVSSDNSGRQIGHLLSFFMFLPSQCKHDYYNPPLTLWLLPQS